MRLLTRLWHDAGIRDVAATNGSSHARPRPGRPVSLITGGAGFVGTNLAARLAETGRHVLVLDNLSRAGVDRNLRWLTDSYPGGVSVEVGDVRDSELVRRAVRNAAEVFHLAAQVAVTSSIADPIHDHAVNVEGTLRLLEELRRVDDPPPTVFTSTNKVYGALPDLELVREGGRWEPVDQFARETGLSEDRPLDFCTPYGCSKGAADQYVRDYAKSYGLPTVVFRMSCIYGPHQQGNEDQGWVAHFLLRALAREPITIYGDGAQVRDLLFVDDLVDALLLAVENVDRIDGRAFNIGGGSGNTASLLEVVELIAELCGEQPEIRFAPERTGDQRYYVSDTTRFEEETGWAPRVGVEAGIEALHQWLERRTQRALEATAR